MSVGLGGIKITEGLYIVRSIGVSVLEESDIVCGLGSLLTLELSEVRYWRMEQRSIERADNHTGEKFAQWVIYIQLGALNFHLFRLY